MKPAPLRYVAPTSLEEALELLASTDDAKVIAGGQSLIPPINMRLSRPALLVDLNRIDALKGEPLVGDGGLSIPALTRHRMAERSVIVAEACPAMALAIPHIGHVQIRNRGTVVGSLVHGDPAAELPLLAVLLDATFEVVATRGAREVAADAFYDGFFSTDLRPDEIVTGVRFPVLSTRAGDGFVELSRRHGDYALVAAAARVETAGAETSSVKVAVAGVDGRPLRLPQVEELLVHRRVDDAALEEAGRAAAASVDPFDDPQASADFKKHLTGVLVRRALAMALASIGSPRLP